jgi:hypothetical protein
VRSLSVDPFPDVRRTVSESDAVAFAECQDFDGLAINQTDVPEIDINCTGFLLERGTKNVHVFISNPPTQAQDSSTFFSQESVDSAGHCSFALVPLSTIARSRSVASVPGRPTVWDGFGAAPLGRWLLDRSGPDRAVART